VQVCLSVLLLLLVLLLVATVVVVVSRWGRHDNALLSACAAIIALHCNIDCVTGSCSSEDVLLPSIEAACHPHLSNHLLLLHLPRPLLLLLGALLLWLGLLLRLLLLFLMLTLLLLVLL
jgi:hypothetical protein